MEHTSKESIRSRKVAILAADGADEASINTLKEFLVMEGAVPEVIAPRLGTITASNNKVITVDKALFTTASVF